MKKHKLFSLLLFVVTSAVAQNVDVDLLKKINVGRNKKLDNTFIAITNSATPLSLFVPVAIYCQGLEKNDSVTRNKGLVIGASFFVTTGITLGMKYGINRERPFATYSFIEKETSGGSPSFPSGHASEAFSTATSLSLAFPKWYVIAPAYLWACSVGYSRMDLGVHYPSDVLVGAAVGAGSAFVCYKVNHWLHNRKARK